MIATGDNIERAANSFRKGTAVGLDLWAPFEIGMCDKSDLDDLGKLMMEWDEEMVVPEQWLVNLMSMIPKKSGHRTVGAMAIGWRINTTLGSEEDSK